MRGMNQHGGPFFRAIMPGGASCWGLGERPHGGGGAHPRHTAPIYTQGNFRTIERLASHTDRIKNQRGARRPGDPEREEGRAAIPSALGGISPARS